MRCGRSCLAIVQQTGRYAAIASGEGTSAGWPLALRIKAQLHFKNYVGALQEYERDVHDVDQAQAEDGLRQFVTSNIKKKSKWLRAAVEAFRAAGHTPSPTLCAAVVDEISGHAANAIADQNVDKSQQETTSAVALIDNCAILSGPLLAETVFAEHEAERHANDPDHHPDPAAWAALIRSRALWGDIRGAEAWFHAWRTGPAHPLVPRNATGAAKRQTWQSLKARGAVSGRPPTASLGFSSTMFRRSNTMRFDNMPRAAHTLPDGPFPDAEPYLALLDGLVQLCKPDPKTNRHTRNPSLLQLVALMAADRVRLTPQVISSLIDVEWARREAQWREGALALYGLITPAMREKAAVDHTLFARVLRAYTWIDPIGPVRHGRRRIEGAYESTELMKASGLKRPPTDLMAGPRKVLRDLFATHRQQPLLTPDLINQAFLACLHCQDFAAAAVILDAMKRFDIAPTAETHQIAVNALLLPRHGRAAFMRVGYGRQQTLLAYVNGLASQELAMLPFDQAVDVASVGSVSATDAEVMITRWSDARSGASLANPAALATKEPWQYILEHREQLCDVGYLHELLREAVPRSGGSKFMALDAWNIQLAKAVEELGLSEPILHQSVNAGGYLRQGQGVHH